MIEEMHFKTLPIDMPPSRYCAICGKTEFDDAVLCTSAFWLCDKCLKKLRNIINMSEEVEE